jgi:hypothetical protein
LKVLKKKEYLIIVQKIIHFCLQKKKNLFGGFFFEGKFLTFSKNNLSCAKAIKVLQYMKQVGKQNPNFFSNNWKQNCACSTTTCTSEMHI